MNNRFDLEAATWDTKPDRIVMAQKFAREIQHLIRHEDYKTALEYGCGTGNVSFFLRDDFERITLADTSPAMIDEVRSKIAREAVAHFTPLCFNLEHDTLPHQYDVIYTLMCMHHVQDVEKVIRQFGRMLAPYGMLIIGDLEKEDGDFHQFPENQNVHWGFEAADLETNLRTSRLALNSYKIFHTMERTHTGISKTYQLFVLSAVK